MIVFLYRNEVVSSFRVSPTLKGGDLRRSSETDFLKSKIAKSEMHSSPIINDGDFCFFDLMLGDYVFFYSDGMEKIIFSEEFRKTLITKNWAELEEECRKIHTQKEGAEGTLVSVLIQ